LNGWTNHLGILILIIFLLPPIKLPFLDKTTYGLAKGLILIFILLKKPLSLLSRPFKPFQITLLFYFLIINFSILLSPMNSLPFKTYSTFALFSLLFFFPPKITKNIIKKISLGVTVFFISIALIQKFTPSLAKILANFFLQKSDYRLTFFNLARSRTYPLGYPEFFLPWLFYFYSKAKGGKEKTIFLSLIGGLFLFVVFSGFRWRFLTFFLALTTYLFFSFKKNIKTKMALVLLPLALLLITTGLQIPLYQRLLFKTQESKNTALSRIEMARKSIYLWRESPILGVGFGNWNKLAPLPFDYAGLPLFYQGFETYSETIWEIKEGWKNAHNWFFAMLAETGIVGLGATLLLAGYIFKTAVKNIYHPASQSLLLFLFATLFENTHLAISALTFLILNMNVPKTKLLDKQ